MVTQVLGYAWQEWFGLAVGACVLYPFVYLCNSVRHPERFVPHEAVPAKKPRYQLKADGPKTDPSRPWDSRFYRRRP